MTETKAPPSANNFDRTQELADIYEHSGLKGVLESKGLKFFPAERFSKLKFVGNDFGISSIEIYPLVKSKPYFRIHYLPRAPQWLKDEFKRWPNFRDDNGTGANFTSDPFACAKVLAKLLSERR